MTASAESQLGRVLIVDDDPMVRALERRALERGGYAVFDVDGAAAAFQMLDDGLELDLMIADLNMPDISGAAMMSRIHKIRPQMKVLYVTGNIDQLLDVRPLSWEGEAFLDKPFTSAGLLEAVRLLLTGSLGTLHEKTTRHESDVRAEAPATNPPDKKGES